MPKYRYLAILFTIAIAAAQPPTPPPQQQYPPPQQQYPPAQQQYPPQQYPPAQQQYPPQQYPPQQYPPAQQYPPQQYPPQQYPPQQYPQQYPGQPPAMPPQQLDQLVSRIALYPDPLLAQVLTAASYWNEIPDAANWANEHANLQGDALAGAIQADQLPWDPSVLALLPFPSVLNMMASDPGWTQALGNAVLAQRQDVMDAVQRQRQVAMQYGYLRSNGQVQVVANPGDIEILPVSPNYIVVPQYNPMVVFAPPRRGFYVGGAISFGPRIFVGSFLPFGWAGPRFGWRSHEIIIGQRPWVRTWSNREHYEHGYEGRWRPSAPRNEHHERGRERDRRH